jgi:hypothetical protein
VVELLRGLVPSFVPMAAALPGCAAPEEEQPVM